MSLLFIHFTRSINSVYMSVPISHFLPVPSPLGVHMFVLYICLYFCFANEIIYTIFLDFIYMCYYTIFVFLFLTHFLGLFKYLSETGTVVLIPHLFLKVKTSVSHIQSKIRLCTESFSALKPYPTNAMLFISQYEQPLR